MIRICDWFDRYRDGELNTDDQKRFEEHLQHCENCLTNTRFLNSLVHALKLQELEMPAAPPARIARNAFEKSGTWDTLLVSWMRPTPAWSALVLLMILVSILWIMPNLQQTNANGEYDVLMMESDPADLGGSAPKAQTDEDLVSWLKQGGNTQ